MTHVNDTMLQASPAYMTSLGAAYHGDALHLLSQLPDASVNLVITSPPFALQRKKSTGTKPRMTTSIGWKALLKWYIKSCAKMAALFWT